MRTLAGTPWFGLLVFLSLFDGPAHVHAEPSPPPSDRPNIIVLLVDDLGYECLGANGSLSFRTPVVDRLARDGMRFTNAYVQPNCTPTRVALMTGRLNLRNYVHFGVLESSQRTFGNLFRDAGYATAIVGKWQLGGSIKDDTPRHFGFDEHCLYHIRGVPKSRGKEGEDHASRYINPGLAINGQGRVFGDNAYAPDLCNDFAMDYIARHRDQPFFLYYPMMLTHAPFDPTPDSSDYPGKDGPKRTKEQHYQDMVSYNDKLIGKLVAKIDALGLTQRTLILFLGDNGTPGGFVARMADGEQVSASKGQTSRAGMHVPLVAYWPGKIAAGGVYPELVDGTDILPTICAAAGINVPKEWGLDGRSFLPQLRGEAGAPRPWIYSWFNPLMPKWNQTVEMAFTKDFKLYASGELYDWRADPEEEHPLDVAGLDDEAKAAYAMLRDAIETYRGERPAEIEAIAKSLRGGDDGEKAPRTRRVRKRARKVDASTYEN
jgi:arylsulfatase A